MFINEIASGSEVLMEVKNKEGKEMAFSTQVVDTLEEGDFKMALVEPFRYNGQMLSFSGVTCQAFITNGEDSRVYKYKLLGVVKREHEGNVCHCLVSNENVAEENRRGAKRFSVGSKASIQLLGGSSPLRGRLNDISATGISFVVGDSTLAIGDKVSVAFEHEITGAQMKVIAQIVRSEDRDKGTLFGCLVNKHDAKYTLLISYLMRQECKLRG